MSLAETPQDVLPTSWRSLQESYTIWKNVDLSGKKGKMDNQALSVAQNKEDSATRRKDLSKQTKEFRKLNSEEKKAQFGRLLKLYQEEVDALTRRSATAESAFLDLYNVVREAPDPHQTFRNILDDEQQYTNSAKLKQENRDLLEQLEKYKKEFTQLKNQEVTIKELYQTIATYENQMERQVEQKQQQVGREQEEMLENLKQRSQLLQEQLRQSQEEAERMRGLYEEAQNSLFTLSSSQEEQQTVQQSQIDMLYEELSTTTSKVTMLEGEKQLLLDRLKEGSESTGNDAEKDGKTDFDKARNEMLVSNLQQQVAAMEGVIQKKKSKIQGLNEQITEMKTTLQKAEHELSLRPTTESYQEVQKRLKIIEDLEFGFEKGENARASKTIEQLLQEKGKRMQTEITNLKYALVEKEQTLSRITEAHSEMERKLKEQTDLIKRLEEDLYIQSQDDRLSVVSSSMISTRSDAGSIVSTSSKGWTPSDTTAASSEDNNLAMIRILSDQRNRYKKRLKNMEEQNQSLLQQITQLKTKIKKLDQENLKLYEKTRYLESYQHSSTAPMAEGSSSGDGRNVLDTIAHRVTGPTLERKPDLDLEDQDPANKYRKIYDNNINDNINPLSRFHKREKSEFFKRLNLAERIALSTSNLMLSNKFGRIFMFWYTVMLHLLVFVALYKSIPRE